MPGGFTHNRLDQLLEPGLGLLEDGFALADKQDIADDVPHSRLHLSPRPRPKLPYSTERRKTRRSDTGSKADVITPFYFYPYVKFGLEIDIRTSLDLYESVA